MGNDSKSSRTCWSPPFPGYIPGTHNFASTSQSLVRRSPCERVEKWTWSTMSVSATWVRSIYIGIITFLMCERKTHQWTLQVRRSKQAAPMRAMRPSGSTLERSIDNQALTWGMSTGWANPLRRRQDLQKLIHCYYVNKQKWCIVQLHGILRFDINCDVSSEMWTFSNAFWTRRVCAQVWSTDHRLDQWERRRMLEVTFLKTICLDVAYYITLLGKKDVLLWH